MTFKTLLAATVLLAAPTFLIAQDATKTPVEGAVEATVDAVTEAAEASAEGTMDEMVFEIVGDADKGKKAFKKCKACHQIGEGAKSKVGPLLTGILGRPAGEVEGFKYSSALLEQAEGGLVWNVESLAEFLTKPKDFLPGTKMTFAGLRKEKDRDNIIAYLASFPKIEE